MIEPALRVRIETLLAGRLRPEVRTVLEAVLATSQTRARGRPRIDDSVRAEIIRRLRAGESVRQVAASGIAGYGTVYRISRSI